MEGTHLLYLSVAIGEYPGDVLELCIATDV